MAGIGMEPSRDAATAVSHLAAGEYAAAFRCAHDALWLEDHSGARDKLRELGLLEGPDAPTDLYGYLTDHPDVLRDVVDRVRILDVNDAGLRRWHCASVHELSARLSEFYTARSYELHAGFYAALLRGEATYSGRDVNQAADGGVILTHTTWTVLPGHEADWRRVVVVDVDVTPAARAERLAHAQRDAAVALSSPGDRHALAARLVATLLELEEVDGAAVCIHDQETGQLTVVAHAGLPDPVVASLAHLLADAGSLRSAAGTAAPGTGGETHGWRAVAAWPVTFDGRPVAAVVACSRTVGSFSPETDALLESVAATTGGAFARLEAEDEARRRMLQMEAIVAIQRELLAQEDQIPFEPILRRLREASDTDRVYAFEQRRNDQGEPRLWPVAASTAPGVVRLMDDPVYGDLPWSYFGEDWRRRLEEGEAVAAVRTGESEEARGVFAAEDVRSLLLLPLEGADGLYGFVGFDDCRRERPWPEADVALLSSAAAAISAALRRRQMLHELRAESARTEALLQASRSISSSLDYDDVLYEIAKQAATAFDSPQCCVWQYLPDTREEVFLTLYERRPEPGLKDRLVGARYPLRDRPHDLDVLRRGTVVEERIADPGLDAQTRADMTAWGETAVLRVPLLASGTALGEMIVIETDRDRRFTEEERRLAAALGELAATALSNASLHRTAEQQAVSDGLTGLYNHRHFYERLEQEVARAQRSGRQLSLLMIDIDDFKRLNDLRGHLAGDEVLRNIGLILRTAIRQGIDLAARYGGEEFAVILPETGIAGDAPDTGEPGAHGPAGAVAERIRQRVERETPVTVSVGVAVYPTTAATMNDLVAQADAALYLAKRAGSNRVEVYGLR